MAALAWVEYCNSAGDTYWANRRRVNGRAAPYQVTYWGLGNEMYGDWQVGAFSAEEYVREATRWARAIRMLDPRATLVSCGMNGWNEWDQVVIDGMAAMVDYHSLHIYTSSEDYWTNVLQGGVLQAVRHAAVALRPPGQRLRGHVHRLPGDEPVRGGPGSGWDPGARLTAARAARGCGRPGGRTAAGARSPSASGPKI